MPTGCPNKGDQALWDGQLDGYLDPVSLLSAFLLNMTLSDARIAACTSEHPTVLGLKHTFLKNWVCLNHGLSVGIRSDEENTTLVLILRIKNARNVL